MTLDNDGFANLVLLVLAGIVIIGAVFEWFRRR